ncbi:MAG: hypothetical protein HYX94_04460 [Chloroflexi bacterium]|nr:hypothetical protein [Chloroflexota bacterium]
MVRRITSIGFLIAILLSFDITPAVGMAALADVGAYFSETGFRITNAGFLDFFNHRGGVRTFGYPVSREFKLYGFKVQFFQRAIMQQRADGSVTILNLLDAGLMPYNRINQSTFPAADPALLSNVPRPGSPGYVSDVLAHIKATVPDTWQSLCP